MFHRTNRCLGCTGFVYVGRIYQNRGRDPFGVGRVCFGDFKYQNWLPEIAYPAFNYNDIGMYGGPQIMPTLKQHNYKFDYNI